MLLLQLKKRLMAIAGLLLTTYLLFHMLGNLSFFSPQHYTAFYAVYNHPFIRWPLWLLVVAALALHVVVALQTRLHNRKARLQSYQYPRRRHIPSWLVSIVITLILLFILWHLIQMWSFGEVDIYQQTQALFGSAWQVVLYLGGLLLLGLHLQHSLTNVLQTMGITAKQYYGLVTLLVVLLIVGFSAVPLAAYWKTA